MGIIFGGGITLIIIERDAAFRHVEGKIAIGAVIVLRASGSK
jgi:hypothetical protein